ncbi:hypothetical protein D3260_08045 [Salinisphaera sp. Q1T1-3]|nr:hypothetical protein D3260_08045 [Salinisphaera sp. Q1T1-3]
MPNHIHLILKPNHTNGSRASPGEARRRDTRHINCRENWRGHLWQERFHAYPMDTAHLRPSCATYSAARLRRAL